MSDASSEDIQPRPRASRAVSKVPEANRRRSSRPPRKRNRNNGFSDPPTCKRKASVVKPEKRFREDTKKLIDTMHENTRSLSPDFAASANLSNLQKPIVVSKCAVKVPMLKRQQSSALNLMMEKWKVKMAKLMHTSAEPDFAKKLRSQLEQEMARNRELKDTTARLGREIKSLTGENQCLLSMHMSKLKMSMAHPGDLYNFLNAERARNLTVHNYLCHINSSLQRVVDESNDLGNPKRQRRSKPSILSSTGSLSDLIYALDYVQGDQKGSDFPGNNCGLIQLQAGQSIMVQANTPASSSLFTSDYQGIFQQSTALPHKIASESSSFATPLLLPGATRKNLSEGLTNVKSEKELSQSYLQLYENSLPQDIVDEQPLSPQAKAIVQEVLDSYRNMMKSKNKLAKDTSLHASPRKAEKKSSPRGKTPSPARATTKDGGTVGINKFSTSPLNRSMSSQNSNPRPPLSPVTPPPAGQKDINLRHCENPDTKTESLKASPSQEMHPPHFNISNLVYREAMNNGNYAQSSASCSPSKYATKVPYQPSPAQTSQAIDTGYVKMETQDGAFVMPSHSPSQIKQTITRNFAPASKGIELIASQSISTSASSSLIKSHPSTGVRSPVDSHSNIIHAPIRSPAINTVNSQLPVSSMPTVYSKYPSTSVPLMMSALSCNVSPYTVSASHTHHTVIQEQQRLQPSNMIGTPSRDQGVPSKICKMDSDDIKESGLKKSSTAEVQSVKKGKLTHTIAPLTVHIPPKVPASVITSNAQSYIRSFSPVTPSESEFSSSPAVPPQELLGTPVSTLDTKMQSDQNSATDSASENEEEHFRAADNNMTGQRTIHVADSLASAIPKKPFSGDRVLQDVQLESSASASSTPWPMTKKQMALKQKPSRSPEAGSPKTTNVHAQPAPRKSAADVIRQVHQPSKSKAGDGDVKLVNQQAGYHQVFGLDNANSVWSYYAGRFGHTPWNMPAGTGATDPHQAYYYPYPYNISVPHVLPYQHQLGAMAVLQQHSHAVPGGATKSWPVHSQTTPAVSGHTASRTTDNIAMGQKHSNAGAVSAQKRKHDKTS